MHVDERGEPLDEEDEDPEERRRQEDAFDRQYAQDHSWEVLQEDDKGRLYPLDPTAAQRERRQRTISAARTTHIRRGMIRYLMLVLDLSRSASASDMRPSRLSVMVSATEALVRAYFDDNPLSQLAIMALRGGMAHRLTELSGSPDRQLSLLKATLETEGDASLQNALDQSVAALSTAPPYGTREVLVLFAALSTVDAGDVLASAARCKEQRIRRAPLSQALACVAYGGPWVPPATRAASMGAGGASAARHATPLPRSVRHKGAPSSWLQRVSIVGVSAEVHVCRRVTEVTGGTYGVALNEEHLQQLMLAHAPPPPAPPGQLGAELVRMGFPKCGNEAVFGGKDPKLQTGLYACPRCRARSAELPCKCHVCGLTLISSPHLARSYHHLFPVAPFEELSHGDVEQLAGGGRRRRRTVAMSISDEDDDEPRGVGGGGGHEALPEHVGGAGAPPGSGAPPKPLWKEVGFVVHCFGCLRDLRGGGTRAPGSVLDDLEDEERAGLLDGGPGMVLRCPLCRQLFCFQCDSYIHEQLHNCPGCECAAAASSGADAGDAGVGHERAANGANSLHN